MRRAVAGLSGQRVYHLAEVSRRTIGGALGSPSHG
jgi:hypothetical protein